MGRRQHGPVERPGDGKRVGEAATGGRDAGFGDDSVHRDGGGIPDEKERREDGEDGEGGVESTSLGITLHSSADHRAQIRFMAVAPICCLSTNSQLGKTYQCCKKFELKQYAS